MRQTCKDALWLLPVLACLAYVWANGHAAPAPLPARERDKGLGEHPAELCGVWRLGIHLDGIQRSPQWWIELCPDGVYWAGSDRGGRPGYTGTWAYAAGNIRIREHSLPGGGQQYKFRVPAWDDKGGISPVGDSWPGALLRFSRPPVTD